MVSIFHVGKARPLLSSTWNIYPQGTATAVRPGARLSPASHTKVILFVRFFKIRRWQRHAV